MDGKQQATYSRVWFNDSLFAFDLMSHYLHFTILVKVFTNHIFIENKIHESYRVNGTQDYRLQLSIKLVCNVINLKTFFSTITT